MKTSKFNSTLDWLKWLLLLIIFLLFIFLITFLIVRFFKKFNPDGNTLTKSSMNNECGMEINEALRSMSVNMGMPHTIDLHDYEAIFKMGKIQKEYYRDGKHYAIFFNLKKTENGCGLHFYKHKVVGEGKSTEYLDDHSVLLKKCQCQ